MEFRFLYHEYEMFDLIQECKFHHDDLNTHLNLLIPIDWLNLAKKKRIEWIFHGGRSLLRRE